MKTIEVPDNFPVAEVQALAEKHNCIVQKVNWHTLRLVERDNVRPLREPINRQPTFDDLPPSAA